MDSFIHPTPEMGKRFYLDYQQAGRVVMLNLLRFRAEADYGQSPALAPSSPISGAAAYRLYMQAVEPLLEAVGGKLLFYGRSDYFVIGPETETWDCVLLVEHASADRFVAFAQDPDYLQVAGHRTAALLDSRLLPIRRRK